MRYTSALIALALMFCGISSHAQMGAGGKGDLQLYKLQLAAQMISAYYVDSVDRTDLVEDAIKGMLEDLDPHSTYISRKDVEKMNEPLKGNFEGIGVQFNILNDTLMVVNPIPGGPSEAVGVMAGDRIVSVNDELVAGIGITNQMVFDRLRGKKGTKVLIKVKRSSLPELIEFEITRDKIPIYSLDASYMVNNSTGYIKLNRFGATTYDEFMKALSELQKSGMSSLILDLQGNGGGYLNAAIKIADEFIEKGNVIVYTKGLNSARQVFNASRNGNFEKGHLVVLIDEASASASEIVTGAIQDWDRGLVIGRRSFGKGLVQRPLNLPDGSEMRLTSSRYYTPTGRLIQKSYEGGRAKYREDLINRYNNGELSSEDSIHFPQSQKYVTLKYGRTVYGGGGIMPDKFIPLDTTEYSKYHRNIVAKGVMNKVVLSYVDHNRDNSVLQYESFEKFDKDFIVTEEMMSALVDLGRSMGVIFNQEEYNRSVNAMRAQYKALVARDIFKTSAFYRVINRRDNAFVKAVKILEDYDLFEKALFEK